MTYTQEVWDEALDKARRARLAAEKLTKGKAKAVSIGGKTKSENADAKSKRRQENLAKRADENRSRANRTFKPSKGK